MPEPLSPAAQSVLQAFDDCYEIGMFDENWQGECLAVALRAAADQVVPDKCPPIEDFNEFDQGYAAAHITHRADLLAIATELEALND